MCVTGCHETGLRFVVIDIIDVTELFLFLKDDPDSLSFFLLFFLIFICILSLSKLLFSVTFQIFHRYIFFLI